MYWTKLFPNAAEVLSLSREEAPRGPLKMYQLRPLENVPGIGGHLKMYQA
jgi:hypothetical protein